MATGVPIVSTRTGQATDLVQHGENGWLADVEDFDALVHWAGVALRDGAVDEVVGRGRSTAEANSYQAQLPLWRDVFRGFAT